MQGRRPLRGRAVEVDVVGCGILVDDDRRRGREHVQGERDAAGQRQDQGVVALAPVLDQGDVRVGRRRCSCGEVPGPQRPCALGAGLAQCLRDLVASPAVPASASRQPPRPPPVSLAPRPPRRARRRRVGRVRLEIVSSATSSCGPGTSARGRCDRRRRGRPPRRRCARRFRPGPRRSVPVRPLSAPGRRPRPRVPPCTPVSAMTNTPPKAPGTGRTSLPRNHIAVCATTDRASSPLGCRGRCARRPG